MRSKIASSTGRGKRSGHRASYAGKLVLLILILEPRTLAVVVRRRQVQSQELHVCVEQPADRIAWVQTCLHRDHDAGRRETVHRSGDDAVDDRSAFRLGLRLLPVLEEIVEGDVVEAPTSQLPTDAARLVGEVERVVGRQLPL